MERRAAVDRVARRIVGLAASGPLRVAIDGVDAAGKTTLADELAAAIEQHGRAVIRASIDGFHRPREQRVRYFEDAFDLDALRSELLDPLGHGGSRRYRVAVYDHRTERPTCERQRIAPEDTVLVFDGIFLQRPELEDCWDFRIFVDVSFDEVMRRVLARDVDLFGSPETVRRRYEQRYFPAQRRYLSVFAPRERADVVFHNDEPATPSLGV